MCRNSVTAEEMLQVAQDPAVGTSDDARAAFALAGVFAIALDPTKAPTIRVKALRIALSYCLPKPKGRLEVELTDGLGWLRSLAG